MPTDYNLFQRLFLFDRAEEQMVLLLLLNIISKNIPIAYIDVRCS